MVFESFTSNLLKNAQINYIQSTVYGYSIEAVIWALIYGVPSLIFYFIARCILRRSQSSRNSQIYDPLLSNENQEDFILDDKSKELPIKELKDYYNEERAKQSILIKILFFLSSLLKVCSVLSLAIIPSILSSTNIIPVAASMAINFVLFLVIELITIKSLCPPQLRELVRQNKWNNFKPTRPQLLKEAYCAFKLHPFLFSIINIIGILYIFFVPLMTEKACLAYYEPPGSVPFGAFHISTAFFRWMALSKICPDGQICHIYSTLPEDSSNSVILNVHTGIDITSLEVSYDTTSNFQRTGNLPSTRQALSIEMNIEPKGSRYIHSVYLDNLTPATSYYVQFLSNGNVLGDANFSTLPSKEMESSIVMIVGGDSSGNNVSTYFINQISNYNPDVILIGGDITYDNGDYNCYYCWDFYLDQFDQLNKKVGRLVPLVLAVGNHDVGQNDHQFLPVDPYQTYFFLYFPQHSKPNSTVPQVPLPEERLTYFSHKIGNILFITLDSGYLVGYNGTQLTWLEDVVSQNLDYAKFATYHVPILPACFFNPAEFGIDPRIISWVPVFEYYRFLTVFENHMHLFKRTFPLSMTNVTDEGPGVVYIGDGAWGINPEDCYDEDPNRNITGIFDTMGKVNHIWVLNVDKDSVNYSAINVTGDVFDTYSQNINDFVFESFDL